MGEGAGRVKKYMGASIREITRQNSRDCGLRKGTLPQAKCSENSLSSQRLREGGDRTFRTGAK